MRKLCPALPLILFCALMGYVPAHAGRRTPARPATHPKAAHSSGLRPLTTVAQVRALSSAAAAASRPVTLHAVVTYYQPVEGQIFAQDATGGVYILPPQEFPVLRPGDEVVIQGTTQASFSTDIQSVSLRLERKTSLPAAMGAGYAQMMGGSLDCRLVRLSGVVRSATLQAPPDALPPGLPQALAPQPYFLIDLLTEGGYVHVHMEGVKGLNPLSLLDAEVEITGVAGGFFDGKMRDIGAQLWVASASQMTVLRRAGSNPADLPLTPIDRVMTAYRVRDLSRRVRVEGAVTLSQPGLREVLQSPQGQAILIHSDDQSPLRLGQVVDAIGFPDPSGYSESLSRAYLLPAGRFHEVHPVAAGWDDALRGRYPYQLVSMEGTLAAEVHERHQDTLVIQAGEHAFSAVLPRTIWNRDSEAPPLPDLPIGSRVRITGVCFVQAGGPWNAERWFELQMRAPDDVTILSPSSWLTVRHLFYLMGGLLILTVGALVRAVDLQTKLRGQTEKIRLSVEAEAARQRRTALLEKERGRVLEAINGVSDLDPVLRMILNFIRSQLPGSTCWCLLANGTRIGDVIREAPEILLVQRDICSGTGERLGSLVIASPEDWDSHGVEILEMGASLAALAIDKRQLYDTLIHRSQYDQLTNAANRFLLESRLDETLVEAARRKTRFALVYIDLDQFKQVNDVYGHRVGDIFLQQVAERFSEKLRGMDTLARVGGDEFIALIPVVRSRAEVVEIAQRLLHAFETPFRIDDCSIQGAASVGFAIYPEDGRAKEELKRVADAAMYASKMSLAE